MADTCLSPMIVAAAALVRADERVLVQQRPAVKAMAGLWEFPGGKLDPGEEPEAALVRELDEELGIGVERSACAPLAFATTVVGARPMVLLLFLVREWTGEPAPYAATALRWVEPAALGALPMPPADRPLVAALRAALAG